VRFLPVFEAPTFSAGEWCGGETDTSGAISVPWFELSDDAQAFMSELRGGGWVFVFDWRAWEPEAQRLIDVGGVEQADLSDLRRLLTLLVRSDRFVEGQLSWAMESGLITRILRRLQAISA